MAQAAKSIKLPSSKLLLDVSEIDELLSAMKADFPVTRSKTVIHLLKERGHWRDVDELATSAELVEAARECRKPLRELSVRIVSANGKVRLTALLGVNVGRVTASGGTHQWRYYKTAEIRDWFDSPRRRVWYRALQPMIDLFAGEGTAALVPAAGLLAALIFVPSVMMMRPAGVAPLVAAVTIATRGPQPAATHGRAAIAATTMGPTTHLETAALMRDLASERLDSAPHHARLVVASATMRPADWDALAARQRAAHTDVRATHDDSAMNGAASRGGFASYPNDGVRDRIADRVPAAQPSAIAMPVRVAMATTAAFRVPAWISGLWPTWVVIALVVALCALGFGKVAYRIFPRIVVSDAGIMTDRVIAQRTLMATLATMVIALVVGVTQIVQAALHN
jgi:hypothetical protein